MLTTTSIQPMTAPKISKEGIASAKFEILQSTNNIMANKIPAGINTLLQPNLEAAAPEIGIVKSDPMPMQRSNIPNTSSPIARRSRNIGTSGAHEAAPNPPIKNIARVECRCSFCDLCGDIRISDHIPYKKHPDKARKQYSAYYDK